MFKKMNLTKIKILLHRMGFIKIETIEKKINILLELDTDLYITYFRSRYNLFVEKDVIIYTNELTKINKFDLTEAYYDVKSITNEKLYRLTYNKWCTDNGHFVEQIDEFKKWLHIAEIVYSKLYNGINLPAMNIYYTNSLKMRPYTTNIENIVDDIFTYMIEYKK